MYCSECGTKNEKDALFCSECGNKLKQEVKEVKKVKKLAEKSTEVKKEEPKKKMSKKKKVLICMVLIIICALGVGYKVLSDITSPKHVASEYVKAIFDNDANKIYNYLEISGDKTFVSKNIFKNYVKKNKSNVDNYKVGDVEKRDLTAIVKVTYMNKGETDEKTTTVSLVKTKGKKYFIFDSWKVADSLTSSLIVEDYKIKVDKDSKLEYAGVKVDSKYKKESTKEYDIYVLPQVFKIETTVKATLPNGIEIENKITPSTYYKETTIKFDKDSLSENMKKEIIKVSKEGLGHIYDCAIDMLEFDRIISYFRHDGLDLTKLENSFSEFKSSLLNSSNKLTSITFTDVDIYDIEFEDGYYIAELKTNYDYTISYQAYDNTEKTVSKSSYGYMKVALKYEDSNFYIYDVSNLKTYFSRY